MKRKLCLNPWFALSGHAFFTEVVDRKDGYTILHAPGGTARGGDIPTSPPSGTTEPHGPFQQEYVLWEFSQASEDRS